jgi:putative transposase
LEKLDMDYVHGAPIHTQTQGKIECWHQILKSPIPLEHYYLPQALQAATKAFIDYYSHQKCRQSDPNRCVF